MNPLTNKYPELFQDGPVGLECHAGWMGILEGLCQTLIQSSKNEAWNNGSPITYPQIVQIKEKFGTLRVYARTINDEQDGAIDAAEAISEFVCEVCGCPGVLREKNNWYSTRCDMHATGADPVSNA